MRRPAAPAVRGEARPGPGPVASARAVRVQPEGQVLPVGRGVRVVMSVGPALSGDRARSAGRTVPGTVPPAGTGTASPAGTGTGIPAPVELSTAVLDVRAGPVAPVESGDGATGRGRGRRARGDRARGAPGARPVVPDGSGRRLPARPERDARAVLVRGREARVRAESRPAPVVPLPQAGEDRVRRRRRVARRAGVPRCRVVVARLRPEERVASAQAVVRLGAGVPASVFL